MTELAAAFKPLRLQGMAIGYGEPLGNGGPGVEGAEWQPTAATAGGVHQKPARR